MSRKVTIKELAATLGVSVPTLRKYGECGLLGVDEVSGRTNLFDEAAALHRVAEINRLKSKGYSLSLIREKLEQPNGHSRLNLGLEDETFSHGRHVLLIVKDMEEYVGFARSFVDNGLRGHQAVVLCVHPDHRDRLEAMISACGHDVEALRHTHQLTFTWYESLSGFDAIRQIESFDATVREVMKAGWSEVRFLGHPEVDPSEVDAAALRKYEERLSDWIAKLPALLVCVWMAPKGNAQTLLELQRLHREFVCGEDTFVKT
ncbi:MAG TPA: MEDS domain-containing protein [Candidatus Eremiobacteraceae bacterium]|nr:MEDS domain-containing protein [Candidatus Eremiobacteraceae bacterium]